MRYLSTRLTTQFAIAFLQILFVSQVFAVPNAITLQTRIIKPNGNALEAPSVNFQITTLDTLGTCVLYIETFAGVSMVGSAGVSISTLGSGGQVYSATGSTYSTIFSNAATPLTCQAGGTYTPATTDRRKVVIQFNDGSSAGWQTLPPVEINSVPFSLQSDNSEKLNGHTASEFTLKSSFPDCNTAGKVLTFNGTAFTCVSSSAGGGSVTNVTSANSYLTVATGTSTPALTVNVGTAANTLAAGNDTRITGAAQKASNLSDLASVATARTNLGSTTTGDALFISASAAAARTTLGLGSAALLTAGTATNNLVQLDGSAKIPAALLPTSVLTSSSTFVGDVTGNSGATVVSTVGAKTAAEVAQSVTDTQAATAANTVSTIMKRDASGNTSVTNLTATSSVSTWGLKIGPVDGAINAGAPMFAGYVPLVEVSTGEGANEEAIVFRRHNSGPSATLRRLGYIMKLTNEANTGESSKSGGVILESTSAWAGNPSLSLVLADKKVLTAATNGNIGMGTTSASTPLHVFMSSVATQDHVLTVEQDSNTATGAGPFIDFKADGGILRGAIGAVKSGTKAGDLVFYTHNNTVSDVWGTQILERMRIHHDGNVGIGTILPTAVLNIKAGTATAGTAPLKLTAGTNLTMAESGAIEFDGTNLFFTDSTPTRRTIATTSGAGSFTDVTSVANSGGNISLSPNSTTGTVQVTSTTASTGAANGALVVNGGVGVGGDIYATSSINAGTTITAMTSILTPQLYGSALASGNILIDGTSHATKGNVILASAGGKVGIGTANPTAALDVSGAASVKSSYEGASAYVNTSTAYTIPDTSVNIVRLTLTANTTVTLPAFTTPTGRMYSMTVFLKQDATGSRTVAYAGNGSDAIKWDSGTAPVISTTAGKITIIQLMKPADETVWYGSMVWREN